MSHDPIPFVGDNDHGDALPDAEVLFAEILKLRNELADAYSKSAQVIADLSANLCTASALERERLTAERDEARREVCRGEAMLRLQRNRVHRESEDVVRMAKEISVERGWDCFKENTND